MINYLDILRDKSDDYLIFFFSRVKSGESAGPYLEMEARCFQLFQRCSHNSHVEQNGLTDFSCLRRVIRSSQLHSCFLSISGKEILKINASDKALAAEASTTILSF